MATDAKFYLRPANSAAAPLNVAAMPRLHTQPHYPDAGAAQLSVFSRQAVHVQIL
jgi:hypothetical protein